MTKGGSVARVGLVTENAAVSRDLIYINSSILPDYSSKALSTYFQTDFFRRLLIRSSSQTAQPHLTITLVRNLPLLRMSEGFEKAVASTLQAANEARQDSINLQQQAEALLLSALGLEHWQPPEALTYERSASEVFGAGRLDAEYFQPSKMLILEATKKAGAIKLSEIASVGTGFPWKSEFFLEGSDGQGKPFVRIRDCKPGRIDVKDLDTLDLAYAEAQNQSVTSDGDIVIGMDGLKYFYGSQTPSGLFVNQRVVHLSPNNPDFPSEYLLAVLNSPVGQLQLLREMTVANTVGHITLEHVRNLEIPVMTPEKRLQITELVTSSAQAKAYSTQLLDLAKRAVEIAIEDSEAAALAYLQAEQLSI